MVQTLFTAAKVGHFLSAHARVFTGCKASLRRSPSDMKKDDTYASLFSAYPCPNQLAERATEKDLNLVPERGRKIIKEIPVKFNL